MKRIKITLAAIVLLVFAAFFTACEPDKTNKPAPTVPEVLQNVQSGVVQVYTSAHTGSGFVIGQSGEGADKKYNIITNYHVIANQASVSAPNISVLFLGRDEATPARVMGYSKTYDIAVLQTDFAPESTHIFEFTDSPQVGEENFTLGVLSGNFCAYGGRVSADNKLIRIMSDYNDYLYSIELAAPAPNGSSGGPTVNMEGKVTGLSTYNVIAGTALYALSYKVPVEVVKAVYNKIIEQNSEQFSLSIGFIIFSDGTVNVTCFDETFRVLPKASGLTVTQSNLESLPEGSIIDKVNGKDASMVQFLAEIISTRGATELILK